MALSCLLLGGTAASEEGLVVRFTIKKTAGEVTKTYTSGVLVQMREAASLSIPNEYDMRLESRPGGSDQVNLIISLKDLSSGRPVYAGSGVTTLKVGESTTLEIQQLEQAPAKYEAFLDTAYGQLPVAR
jgi:hypothetical protein